MMKKAIIYLHGFNSASLDVEGNLLMSKEKLQVMQDFCVQKDIFFYTPNVDYRDFEGLVEDILFEWNQYLDKSYEVFFMGSSMGGFTSEYLAMKTGCKAIMINPAIQPSELLPKYIGNMENFETAQRYEWQQAHCEQFKRYEQELASSIQVMDRTVLLDMADELIDSEKTLAIYKEKANVLIYAGGSHRFEHMQQALVTIENVIFS